MFSIRYMGALNHQSIEYNPERITKIKPVIDQYH